MVEKIELSFYGSLYSDGCPACFRKEPQPAGLDKIYENEGFNVHQDYEIPIPNFWIIEAKRHIASMEDFTEKEVALLGDAWRRVRQAMRETAEIERVTAFQQDKSSHFHFCLLPDEPWMRERISNYQPRDIQNTMDWARNNLPTLPGIRQVEVATQSMKDFIATD